MKQYVLCRELSGGFLKSGLWVKIDREQGMAGNEKFQPAYYGRLRFDMTLPFFWFSFLYVG